MTDDPVHPAFIALEEALENAIDVVVAEFAAHGQRASRKMVLKQILRMAAQRIAVDEDA